MYLDMATKAQSGDEVDRSFDSVSAKLRTMKQNHTAAQLLDDSLLTVKQVRKSGDHWCDTAAELCATLFKQFAEQRPKVVSIFHLWGATPMPQPSGGCNSIDCFWYLGKDGKAEQQPKKPQNQCYSTVPISLGYKPSDAEVTSLIRFATTTFAG
eukprot:1502564-Karenia_brevis.AAC.1